MYRPRSTSVVVFAAAMLGLAVACSSAPEEPLLRQYFRASQLRDSTTLASFAAAEFDPRTEGIVSSFDIVSVSPEQTEPLMFVEMDAAVNKARMANDEHAKNMKAYQDENLRAIERVLKAESAGEPVARRDEAVQEAWRTWRDEGAAFQGALSDTRAKLNANLPVMQLSAQGADGVDVRTVGGQMVSKDVTIDANVRSPEGTTTERQLVVTMVRGVFDTGAGEPVPGRWVITRVQ